MEAREIKRLPEDLEAEQRYLEELKGGAPAQRPEDRASARARLLQLSEELDESGAAAEASLLESTAGEPASGTAVTYLAAETHPTPEHSPETLPATRMRVDDSDEAAAEVLRNLQIEMAGKAPSYGVIYRMARWIDDLMSSIFKRPTF